MANISSFKGLRPINKAAKQVSELPYDVVSFDEAKKIAHGNDFSFFHVIRPEIDLSSEIKSNENIVYQTGKKNLNKFIENGIMEQDTKPLLYLYSQILDERMQTGIVACVSIDDYLKNVIKKHEQTRKEKEKDRTDHLDILNANTGPVFLIYRGNESKNELMSRAMKADPVNDFTTADGVRHIIRLIDDEELIRSIENEFSDDILYIADGHHRAASAANVGLERKKNNRGHTGREEYNRFLAVLFPHDQLKILAYNRVIKDFNGMTRNEFLDILSKDFNIQKSDSRAPVDKNSYSMYVDKQWYILTPLSDIKGDTIDRLDVMILQKKILGPVLGVDDPRISDRIDFIGGIKGTEELERLVDSGEFKIAFSLYPTTMEELLDISYNDMVMPPKSTWFEPKLRSGLFVHLLD